MIHAEDYRAKAADCARRAEEAQDDYHRKNFLQLAAMWSEMADKAAGRSGHVQSATERDEPDQQIVVEALSTIKNASTN